MAEPTKSMTSHNDQKGFNLSFIWGVLILILGVFAIVRPLFASLATNYYIGGLFVIAGVIQLVYSFQTREEGQFLGKLLIGVFYLIGGGFLLFYPLEGLLTLTAIIAATILASGVVQVFLAFSGLSKRDWVWQFVRGVLALLLGIAIFAEWPSSAIWVLGLLVGINFVFDGAGIISLALLTQAAPDEAEPSVS
jgi:uncharacterized membrane protein HdeD (DUF308 family)